MMAGKLPYTEYLKTVPKKIVSTGILIQNAQQEILIVKPSYREFWTLPGGMTDENEAPLAAAIRELKEETGLIIPIKRLLCIDIRPAQEGIPDNVQMIFSAEYNNEEIVIDKNEISSFEFLALAQAMPKLLPALAKRIAFAVQAIETDETYYLEDGENPFGKMA